MANRGNPYHDPHTGRFTSGSISGQMFNVGFGMKSTREEDKVKYFPTEAELIEYRRENQIQQYEEEKKQLNAEEKRRDTEKKTHKAPRQAMKKQYGLGEKISLDGKAYTVVVVHELNNRLAGYIVMTNDGQYKYISRFGELMDDYPERRRDL